MPESYNQKQKSIDLKTGEESADYALAANVDGKPATNALRHKIETEKEYANLTLLSSSQALTGLPAIGAGLVLIGMGAYLISNTGSSENGAFENNAIKLFCSFPALIGLLFLRDGINSIRRHMQKARSRLNGGKVWDTDFPDRPKTGVNDSGVVAKKIFVNFLWGLVVLIPGIYLGLKNGLSSTPPQSGILFLTGIGVLWVLVALLYTLNKLRIFFGSRKLSLTWQTFPLFLGQTIALELKTGAEQGSTVITEAMLRAIQETTIVTPGNANSRGTVQRLAVQLYCDTIARPISLNKGRFDLNFELPNRSDLNTDLLADDPVYWCLTVKGSSNNLPVDASFRLPVYFADHSS